MNSAALAVELRRRLQKMVGRRLFFVYCGPSTGSVIDIHFYPIRARKRCINNTYLDSAQKRFQGSESLYIECGWRLERDGVCECSSDAPPILSKFRPFESLKEASVLQVSYTGDPRTSDLTLKFSSGHFLLILRDHINDHGEDDYSLFSPDSVVIVTSDGLVVRENVD